MQSSPTVGLPVQYGSDQRCTSARSASQGLACSALPHAHSQVLGRLNLDKLDVGTPWKKGVMLYQRPDVMQVVADSLSRHRPRWVVLDTVMVAKSGDRLLPENCVLALKKRLLPLATVLTPNLPEAAVLAGEPEITSEEQMTALAAKLLPLMSSGAWLLLKGGHLGGSNVPDLLTDGKTSLLFNARRIETKNTHGTGCTLSSAIATLLPQCGSVSEAVEKAKDYLWNAINHSGELSVGHGHGPVHHFYKNIK